MRRNDEPEEMSPGEGKEDESLEDDDYMIDEEDDEDDEDEQDVAIRQAWGDLP